MEYKILPGDVLQQLSTIPDESVNCVVTSPPYWGLRDYGVQGQIGLESSPVEYIEHLVAVFREVRRVLAKDGTCWINMGDTYAADRGGTTPPAESLAGGVNGKGESAAHRGRKDGYNPTRNAKSFGMKHKDLLGMPWRVAFALQEDGWWLRQDIIWSKPNPMPESVTDRCTKAHEYLFMLTKSARYHYNAEAIKEPMSLSSIPRLRQNIEEQEGSYRANGGAKTNGTMKAVGKLDKQSGHSRRHAGFNDRWDSMSREEQCSGTRNKRSVWEIATKPFSEAHFATFPPKLVEPCVLAGCPENGLVLDPFCGSGTTGEVALKYGRNFLGIELNPEYIKIAHRRIRKAVGLFLGETA